MPDVFISYSRRDADFVRRLHTALSERGKDTWVDWEDIPAAAEWREELRTGIDGADAFVFVISPASLTSRECGVELARANEQSKRIVPIVLHEPDGTAVPDTLAGQNWIFFREHDDFDAAMRTLVGALETDLAWVRAHPRLLVRADEWERHGRDRSYLLSGSDLREAESLLAETTGKDPAPTAGQREYVAAGREQAVRRQRRLLAGVSVALVVAVGFAIFALIQRSAAVNEKHVASSRGLAALAVARLPTDPELSVLLAEEALKSKDTPEAEEALRRAVGADQVRLRLVGHFGPINAIAYSPDGDRIVTAGGSDGTARLWNAANGHLVATLPAAKSTSQSQASVQSVAFSDDGRYVAAGGSERDAHVWDGRTGKAVATLTTRGDAVDKVAFSPDGRFLLTGDNAGEAVIWRIRDAKALYINTAANRVVTDAAWSPDQHRALVGYDNGLARVIDLSAGGKVKQLRGHTASVTSVAFTADSRVMATGSQDGTIRLRRPDGSLLRVLSVPDQKVQTLDFSPHGHRVLASLTDNTAREWSVSTGALIDTMIGHDGSVVVARYSPDGRHVVTASEDGTARVWQSGTGRVALVLGGNHGAVDDATFSPDGRYVAVAGRDSVARVFEATPGRPIAVVHTPQPVRTVAWEPDGRTFAAAGDEAFGAFYDARTGALRQGFEKLPERLRFGVRDSEFSPDGKRLAIAFGSAAFAVDPHTGSLNGAISFSGHNGFVNTVAYSRDGKLLLTSSDDGTARLWNARDGTAHGAPLRMGSPVAVARFSPDGRYLIAGAGNGIARIRPVAGGGKTVVLSKHDDKINDVAISPDDRIAATTSLDRTLKLWDARTGDELITFHSPNYIFGVTFSHDGRKVAIAEATGTATILDARTGLTDAVLTGHQDLLNSVEFSPDDRFLLTASIDGTARVWSADDGQELAVLGAFKPTAATISVAAHFSPDGRRILVGSASDREAIVYPCLVCGSVAQVEANARRIVSRSLTPRELARYAPGV